jgi:superfamily I DNA and RNA helicase
MLICGCAGSGKTMLAVEKVKRLADQGLVPLFVCFNSRLRDSVREMLTGWRSAAVDTFHGLCERWIAKAKIRVDRRPGDEYWDRQLADGLMAATKKIPERFDAIVVDEGQDFFPNWWKPLEATLKDERRGMLTVFYDDNQTLYNRELKFPPVDHRLELTENVRNVRRVHDLVAKFYRMNRRLTSRASLGPEPKIVIYRTVPELLTAVEKTLDRWAHDEKIGPQHIAIVTGHGKEKSAIWRAKRIAGYTLTDATTPKPGEIVWSSVHGFKGLERAAVILAEIEPLSHAELDTILYVGCSRARVHLTVIASEAASKLARIR